MSGVTSNKEKPIDHTLPVYYLWPATTDSGTLLCRVCNGNKTGKWPSEFYTDAKLHQLAVHTGFDYHLLAGEPQYNPEALPEVRSCPVLRWLPDPAEGHNRGRIHGIRKIHPSSC